MGIFPVKLKSSTSRGLEGLRDHVPLGDHHGPSTRDQCVKSGMQNFIRKEQAKETFEGKLKQQVSKCLTSRAIS